MSDNEININLQKMNKAERWDAALVNQKIDPFTVEEVKKKMMLERFQEEVSTNKAVLFIMLFISIFFVASRF